MSDITVSKESNNVSTPKKVLTLGYLGYGTGTHEPFDQVFPNGVELEPSDIAAGADIDALVIWGGADISPSIYGHAVSTYTGATEHLSVRDRVEVNAAKFAISRGIPILGICRGAQLVCALAGGFLIQHVNNHGISHPMTTDDGREIMTSSVHHQMMYPYDVEHKLIAWSTNRRSDKYVVGDNSDYEPMHMHHEPEVVWFPTIKGLAIQGHPEFHRKPLTDPFVQYCMEVTRKYLEI
jgi:GMP synthase-like glutamine amidotransferase